MASWRSPECRARPLWKHATQAVFRAGPGDARIMLVGAQRSAT